MSTISNGIRPGAPHDADISRKSPKSWATNPATKDGISNRNVTTARLRARGIDHTPARRARAAAIAADADPTGQEKIRNIEAFAKVETQ